MNVTCCGIQYGSVIKVRKYSTSRVGAAMFVKYKITFARPRVKIIEKFLLPILIWFNSRLVV